jgi:hypothetical protein
MPVRRRQKHMALTIPTKFGPLRPWFERHRRDGWTPVAVDGDGDPRGSKFAGAAWLVEGEPWPRCPLCGHAMALFIQLDLGVVPRVHPGLAGGLFQAFLCVNMDECVCGPSVGDPLAANHVLRVLDPGTDGPRVDGSRRRPGRRGDPAADDQRLDAPRRCPERAGRRNPLRITLGRVRERRRVRGRRRTRRLRGPGGEPFTLADVTFSIRRFALILVSPLFGCGNSCHATQPRTRPGATTTISTRAVARHPVPLTRAAANGPIPSHGWVDVPTGAGPRPRRG